MKAGARLIPQILMLFIFSAGVILGGCSGGGGGGGGFDSAGTGTVALFLADNPSDDYAKIFLYVQRVILISSTGGQYTVFESEDPEGHRVNLLKYREKDFLLTVRDDVPAGFYSKIRLEVSKVQAVAKPGLNDVPCEDNIKLPSNRVDLNPRGGFYVRSGESLGIRLDIDANKSFALHEAGNSGKCIFRPVVFVDIESIKDIKKCPDILEGEIIAIQIKNGIIESFVLDLGEGRKDITVELADSTNIFDGDGNFIERNTGALQEFQSVRVRGWLTANGTLRATLIVVGDVLIISGTADGEVGERDTFPLLMDPDQELIGANVDVLVSSQTLVLTGCDTEVRIDAIQQFIRTEVIGKYDVAADVLKAVAVLLKSVKEIRGFLGAVDQVTGGYSLKIFDSENMAVDQTPAFTIFLPGDAPVKLLGDGFVPIDLLSDLVKCKRREVIVRFDEDESMHLVAHEVVVVNETVNGTVVSDPDPTGRTLELEVDAATTLTVKVRLDANIYKQGQAGGNGDNWLEFDAIKNGDNLKISGLAACDQSDADFYGFAVVIFAPEISL